MKHEYRFVMGMLAFLVVLVIVSAIVVAKADVPPRTVSLTGGFQLSGAPKTLTVAECLRVDLVSAGSDGSWADLTLPYVPPSIWGVTLFDGYHLIYGNWTQTGENTLRLFFWPEDVARLDGTVGMYLVILAEGA